MAADKAIGDRQCRFQLKGGGAIAARVFSTERCSGVCILLHGFAGAPDNLASLGRALAERLDVWSVLPEQASLLGGQEAQEANVQTVVHLAASLAELDELGLPPTRPPVLLGGHSAGGCVALEAAGVLCTQEGGVRVAGVLLLDAVPFTAGWGGSLLARTTERIRCLRPPLRVLSLEAPPCAWNAHGLLQAAVAEIRATSAELLAWQIRVNGASHVDPMDDPGFFARLLTGGWSARRHRLFLSLATAWCACLLSPDDSAWRALLAAEAPAITVCKPV